MIFVFITSGIWLIIKLIPINVSNLICQNMAVSEWMMDSGCQMPDAGYRMPDEREVANRQLNISIISVSSISGFQPACRVLLFPRNRSRWAGWKHQQAIHWFEFVSLLLFLREY